jgi:alkylated DNA repair dioxygenase AlkB
MKQISLMNDLDKPLAILSKDGEVTYHKDFYAEPESQQLFKELLDGLDWQFDELLMFGKKITTSRKVVWVADQNLSYTYSGVKKNPQGWSAPLLSIKQKLESFCGHQFNSCLLNLYHDGDEGMGWHSDDEKELDQDSPIASLSFGGRRKFSFRHKKDLSKASLFLDNGSLLLMRAPTQAYWQHALLKTKLSVEPRINLTFRKIRP